MTSLRISTLAGSLLRGSTPRDVASRLVAAGFDGVEIPADPKQDPEELARPWHDAGLAIVNVGMLENLPRDFMSPQRTPKSLREWSAPALRLAAVSDARQCQWCCLERPAAGDTIDQFRSRLVERLSTMGSLAFEAGVTFLFEPLASDSAVIATSTDEGLDLVHQANSPGVKITFDTCHSVAAGEDVVDGMRRSLPLLKHVHLSDLRRTNQHFERPLPGRGSIDYGRFLSALAEVGYDGYVGLEAKFETDDHYAELATSVAYLRQIAPP